MLFGWDAFPWKLSDRGLHRHGDGLREVRGGQRANVHVDASLLQQHPAARRFLSEVLGGGVWMLGKIGKQIIFDFWWFKSHETMEWVFMKQEEQKEWGWVVLIPLVS